MKASPAIALAVITWTSVAASQLVDSLDVKGTRIDVDPYGNVFALDAVRNILSVYSSRTGALLHQMGGEGWGNDQFDRPVGLSARNGMDVFVADYGNHRIQRFDRNLTFVSSFSTRADENLQNRFEYPGDVALSRLGDLFICDTENSRVLKINSLSQVERTFGGYDAGEGRLVAPMQIEIGPKDVVYVLDAGRILKFDVFGNYLQELTPGLFQRPSVLYANPDEVLVLDQGTLYGFDAEERPMVPVSVPDLTGGRVRGEEVLSLGLDRDVLFLLTPHRLYLVRELSALQMIR